MASRNTIRQYSTESYYHIYNRGVGKQLIFKDSADYSYFIYLLKRHLGTIVYKDKSGRKYAKYDQIELLAYCLMPNHFHLFVYQMADPKAFTQLLRSICTAYTMYFNHRYDRVGHLFQDRFKASHIDTDSYLLHVSRYIHCDPKDPFKYEWSSLGIYMNNVPQDWLNTSRILSSFTDAISYRRFIKEYRNDKKDSETLELSEILADI